MKHTDLIRQMTLEEKCSLLSGRDEWNTYDVERLGIPSISLSDGPSGLRRQAGKGDHLGLNASTKAVCVPAASTLANSWDPQVSEKAGTIVGADARAQGVQVVLGPGLNTKRSGLCGRSFEYYSEDPYLAGKLAAGYVRGVQSNGVAACLKHFAANSQEHLRMHSDSVMDERTLRELYLTNFEIAVTEGKPYAVMTSYNRLNGIYTNEDPYLYNILRKEWGFDGMVVTDWGGSNDFVAGVRAGMDLEMPTTGADSAVQLQKAVAEGRIKEDEIDARLDELLDIVIRTTALGPTMAPDPQKQHKQVRTLAEKCAVLLKNDNSILPLSKEARIAVIGDFAEVPRYQGAGSSMVNAHTVDAALDFVDTYFPQNIGYAKGFERLGQQNNALEDKAIQLAATADCVLLYIGLPEGFETEGLDRTHMRLPENQIRLLHRLAQINPHIIAVLSCGSVVEMPWIEDCEALVYGGLGGEAGAEAILRILRGDAVPGGKLAETFPLVYEDNPVHMYYPGLEATSEYREGIYVGYRYFTTVGKPVRFPFGFGLSYTSFAYRNLEVDNSGVSFEVANTGTRDGDEVAQMYISLPDALAFRPARELKGFVRISLKAGESKRVSIPFDAYTFRYFDHQTRQWETEEGKYHVLIGASSEDIRLKGSLWIQGSCKHDPYAGLPVERYRHCNLENIPDMAFEALLGRPLPVHFWDRNQPLGLNDTVRQLYYAKNPLAKFVCWFLTRLVQKAAAQGKPDLNLLFIYNITFRGMAKMLHGMVTMAMAEDILSIVNGHGFCGLTHLFRDYFNRPKNMIK